MKLSVEARKSLKDMLIKDIGQAYISSLSEEELDDFGWSLLNLTLLSTKALVHQKSKAQLDKEYSQIKKVTIYS